MPQDFFKGAHAEINLAFKMQVDAVHLLRFNVRRRSTRSCRSKLSLPKRGLKFLLT